MTMNGPSEQIYDFNGLFEIETVNGINNKESLGLENTLWANTVLASGFIYVMVIYTGKETRMQMNSRQPRTKIGMIDKELNKISKELFVFMVVLAAVLEILNGIRQSWMTLLLFFRYLLILSCIIPISLRVNCDLAKLIYSYKINKDKEIQGTVARNTAIPEELGRIQYLFTDKTGTLTQNEMTLKKISFEFKQYSKDQFQDISRIFRRNQEKAKASQIKKEQSRIIKNSIKALSICHNVTPADGRLEASSPDEVALVEGVQQFGIELISRNEKEIIAKFLQSEEKFDVLRCFPFSSERKRMGIIVKQNEEIFFYLKGADTVMKQVIPEVQRGFLQDECDNLAREGLRTLVICQKHMTQQEYNNWNLLYEQATQALENRKEKCETIIEQLENNMQFLCVTGVEDQLQDQVKFTLENMRNAGINIWMLTGDKIETALCIALSTGIKQNYQNDFIIKEIEDEIELTQLLNQFSIQLNCVLVIDGISLRLALARQKELFINVAKNAPAVICSRCSPTQKAVIVELIKKNDKRITCSIGDGGNDVAMIQAADIGVGIVGKEGMQAALAADYSIQQFSSLNKLFLYHGRLSYKRSAILSQFVIHRGLIISIIEAVFISIFYFVAMSIYNGVLLFGYSTIFTMLPVFSLIFDQDVDWQTALNYPPLYATLAKGRDLNTKTFLYWVWKSIYQGSIIMIMPIYLFDNSYFNIVTITFTALILTEYLNIISELNTCHIVMIICQFLSLIIYIFCILFLKSLLNVSCINIDFIWKVIVITLSSWLPLHLYQYIKGKIYPSDYQRLMKGLKKKTKINTNII